MIPNDERDACECEDEYPYFNLNGNACVYECQESEFLNLEKTQCVDNCDYNFPGVIEGIQTENVPAHCTCDDYNGFVLYSGICKCADNMFLNFARTKCVMNCFDDDENILGVDGEECVEQCEEELFYNVDGTQCVRACG